MPLFFQSLDYFRYTLRPTGYETITISNTAVGLTAAKAAANSVVVIRFEDGDSIRFTFTAPTPTATVGVVAFALDQLVLNRDEAIGFLAIRTGTTDMTAHVLYYVRI